MHVGPSHALPSQRHIDYISYQQTNHTVVLCYHVYGNCSQMTGVALIVNGQSMAYVCMLGPVVLQEGQHESTGNQHFEVSLGFQLGAFIAL